MRLGLWIVIGCLSLPVMAEQRALLVGVGQYQMPGNDLAGIDLDLDNMEEVARWLGFRASQIKRLENQQATLANVTQQMKTWLVEGVNANDKILFYFSGHGTRVKDLNHDEPDQADEVLVLHDTKPGAVDAAQLQNVLLDDVFAQLLKNIPSQQVMVVIDACHSGTATKSFGLVNRSLGVDHAQYKLLYYPGMPMGSDNFTETKSQSQAPLNYVSLSAAQDDEKAIATSKGSLFTRGLHQQILAAGRNHTALTPVSLVQAVGQYIGAHIEKARVHHPQLNGNPKLQQRQILLRQPSAGKGKNWQRLVAAASKAKQRLNVNFQIPAGRAYYRYGDPAAIQIQVPRAGYLNVVQVDANDQTVVLFPNKYTDQNYVQAGALTVPTPELPFEIEISEPQGQSLVAVFLTQHSVNLFKQGHVKRDNKGLVADDAVFSEYDALAARGMKVVAKKRKGLAAGMKTVEVRP